MMGTPKNKIVVFDTKVGLPVVSGWYFIDVSQVIFCKAEDNYTTIYLLNEEKFVVSKTLKWMEELLSEHRFFRVHASYLINLNHIIKYLKTGEGGLVELTGQQKVNVSRRKKNDFINMLTVLNMIKK